MYKKLLYVSIAVNFLFLAFGGYILYKKGGLGFLKAQVTSLKTTNNTNYKANYKVKTDVFKIVPKTSEDIIFLGNSLTDYCNWSELFNNPKIKNRGIAADVISGVINRIDDITAGKPKKIFLMIGINDLGRLHSTSQILKDYKMLLSHIVAKSPTTKIYIQSLLPTNNTYRLKVADIIEINNGLKTLATDFNMVYINLFDVFKTDNNTLNPKYSIDGLHINAKGYLLWQNSILNYVNEPF